MNKQGTYSDLTERDQVTLAHVFAISIQTMKTGQEKDFGAYWKNADAFLTLEVANELIQSYRVIETVLEPLIVILAFSVSKTQNYQEDLMKDISQSLLKILERDVSIQLFEKVLSASVLIEPHVDAFKCKLSKLIGEHLERSKEFPELLANGCEEPAI